MDEIKALILRAREGKNDAFEKICSQYGSLLYSMSRRYSSMCSDIEIVDEDFQEEAKIALYKAVLTYDVENLKVTFGAYARACIRNRLVSCVRKIRSKKRQKCITPYALQTQTPQDAVIWRELGEKLLAKIRFSLSPYEKKIFSYYVEGKRAKEISGLIGKSEKSVNNAIFRIRSKLKETVK